MKSYRDEAIVLRTHKLGEADRIITLLTAEHGQVRAVAKGVKSIVKCTVTSTDKPSDGR